MARISGVMQSAAAAAAHPIFIYVAGNIMAEASWLCWAY